MEHWAKIRQLTFIDQFFFTMLGMQPQFHKIRFAFSLWNTV